MHNSEPNDTVAGTRAGRGVRLLFSVAALAGLVVFGVAVFRILIWSIYHETFWIDIVQQQVPAIIGLPLAAIASLGLVLILESASGPIEFEAAGLKFKGASGPIVLWVLCFLAMAIAIKLTWLSQHVR